MMNRIFLHSISLRFIIVCILLTSFSHISYATMVQSSEEEGLIAKHIAKNLADKKQLSTLLLLNKKPLANYQSSSYLHTDLLSSPATTKPNVLRKQQASFFQVDVKKTGKAWLVKNLDDELLQEPLLAFKKTKQLYNKTDKILVDLTQQLLRSLELEQLNKLKQRPVTEEQQKLYRSIGSNSAQKTSELLIGTGSDNIFLKVYRQLVRIETVFYLLAFLFFYSIVKWLIRQILIPKY